MRFLQSLFLIVLTIVRGPEIAATQDPITARVDRVFAAYDRKDSPGCALGVYRDGKIVYARGYGMADLRNAMPITPRTVFDIGSTSKQFTAASILLLAQRGKLSLDDDVRRYIPKLPQYQKPITIRHLLHHTSGLRDYIGLMTLGGASTDGHTTAKDALDAIVRQKALNFEPGAEYLYSNSGYFLLAQIVERVSGKSMREFAAENIFAPLGMQATQVLDNHKTQISDRAIGYAPASSGFRVAMSNWEQTGDGAVQTTIEDLLRWDRNFYEPVVGGEALLKEFLVTGTLNDGKALPYARGLITEKFRGLNIVSHGGSWAGYRAELIRFPEERFAVATLCNLATANPSARAREVAAIYLEDKLLPAAPTSTGAPAPATAPPGAQPATAPAAPAIEVLRTYEGTYFSDELNTTFRVAIDDGVLQLHRPGARPVRLRALSEHLFTGGGDQRIRFTPGAGGSSPDFDLSIGRVRGLKFVRIGTR